ncbi:MAG: class I SAM-dependent methyltransferase [Paludibacteraceae bacterium]|nr:class I SAM-dependent methyltransferase [Paludibacteraceae bacterium]
MKKNVYLYRVSSWLKHQLTARNTGGHGVHSPYLFEWVRMVMSDKNTYYVWDEIEEIRQEMLKDTRELEFVDYGSGGPLPTSPSKGRSANMRRVCDIAKGSLARRKEAQLLARLVGWLGRPLLTSPSRGGIGDEASEDRKGLTIVELGTSLGVTTAYLAAMDSRNKVVTYEGCPAVAEVARANWEKLGLSNIACVVGEITVDSLQFTVDSLQLAVDSLSGIDVAFIDANHTCEATLTYFNALVSRVHEKSVVVVDDIHYNADMEKAWKAICADERVTTTMDLYRMGLVFFDKHYWRKHYKMRI